MPSWRGMITIGFQHVSINDINEYSLWNVEGRVIFKGRAGFGTGAEIADGCIVGANSFVSKNFNQKNCIIAGNPAGIINENVN